MCKALTGRPATPLARAMPPPPEIAFEDADLSPMARSFYEVRRRIGNARIKSELSVQLAYPTYREGLAALLTQHKNP